MGLEIVREARKVLDAVCSRYGHKFIYSEVLLGGASIDAHGVPLTEEAVETAKASDAVLMGLLEEMQRLLPGTDWSRPDARRQDCWQSARS